ncbi:LOW QUALITY PROTEIN: hypothetical protein QC762_0107140 [Podospora pseudocomata]|uniref:Uncharacterized protein n=1 Tax=Podospora pseudocomata TaxID=2093779 RepID=A0ABR0G379_9PEZI|nr:LOW QUALITY PROTEIN: hypothetical protein QC762_0107140 [Podospora pseudocomata]
MWVGAVVLCSSISSCVINALNRRTRGRRLAVPGVPEGERQLTWALVLVEGVKEESAIRARLAGFYCCRHPGTLGNKSCELAGQSIGEGYLWSANLMNDESPTRQCLWKDNMLSPKMTVLGLLQVTSTSWEAKKTSLLQFVLASNITGRSSLLLDAYLGRHGVNFGVEILACSGLFEPCNLNWLDVLAHKVHKTFGLRSIFSQSYAGNSRDAQGCAQVVLTCLGDTNQPDSLFWRLRPRSERNHLGKMAVKRGRLTRPGHEDDAVRLRVLARHGLESPGDMRQAHVYVSSKLRSWGNRVFILGTLAFSISHAF